MVKTIPFEQQFSRLDIQLYSHTTIRFMRALYKEKEEERGILPLKPTGHNPILALVPSPG